MKPILILEQSVTVMAFMALYALAQSNPRAEAKITEDDRTISIEYGQPSLKGRPLFDLLIQLEPGHLWRLGADKSTTLATTADLEFDNVIIPKGQYSLWAQREADIFWNLIFNKEHGQWGTQHDRSRDFASIPLTQTATSDFADMLTIGLAKKPPSRGEIIIHWADLKLTAGFRIR